MKHLRMMPWHLNYTYVNSQAQTIEFTRFAYTTKDLLKNAVIQAESLLQRNMCSGGNTDETFRLLKDNWVLHAFCCRGLQQSIKGATQLDFELTHPSIHLLLHSHLRRIKWYQVFVQGNSRFAH